MRPIRTLSAVWASAMLLAACYGETVAEAPPAQEPTRDAVGHYCGMIVAEHPGPKAQIFLKGREEPIWFSSVRDAFAFMKLPGEAKNVQSIYVNDMGRGNEWNSPRAGTWIDAQTATFVLDSSRKGGMGMKETVPFSSLAEAEKFIAAYGGMVVSFDKVPLDYVLGDDTAPEETPRGSGREVPKKSGEGS